MTAPTHEKPESVSSIELFFDLVFVFVITQITHLVEHAHGAMDFLRALLVLVPIWWMYAAYVWLTNTVRVTWQMRLVLIAAMAGFLVMAMAIPQVFGAGALSFGLSYLFVVVLHLGAFALKGEGGAARAIFGVTPFNLGASALPLKAIHRRKRRFQLL
jgi:low temperature requirement protein LtrA